MPLTFVHTRTCSQRVHTRTGVSWRVRAVFAVSQRGGGPEHAIYQVRSTNVCACRCCLRHSFVLHHSHVIIAITHAEFVIVYAELSIHAEFARKTSFTRR